MEGRETSGQTGIEALRRNLAARKAEGDGGREDPPRQAGAFPRRKAAIAVLALVLSLSAIVMAAAVLMRHPAGEGAGGPQASQSGVPEAGASQDAGTRETGTDGSGGQDPGAAALGRTRPWSCSTRCAKMQLSRRSPIRTGPWSCPAT